MAEIPTPMQFEEMVGQLGHMYVEHEVWRGDGDDRIRALVSALAAALRAAKADNTELRSVLELAREEHRALELPYSSSCWCIRADACLEQNGVLRAALEPVKAWLAAKQTS